MSDLHALSLAEAASLIHSRQVSPVELAEAMNERVASLNPRFKAYATPTPELALAQARAAEHDLKHSNIRSPMHGVPIGLKDLIATPDAPANVGSIALRGWNPDGDATVGRRLREAGAVTLGKLQMTEGAFGMHHPDIEIPVNPWNADAWPGVSSSGSGVAPACGLAFGALGTDTGGSIRFPSYACGLTGLKPTWGRVSRAGVFPLADSLDHIGPMARTAHDCALMLQVVAGIDLNDPTSLPAPVPNYVGEMHRGVQGLRLGVDERLCSEGLAPEIAAALREASEVLQASGALVVPITMPDRSEVVDRWTVMCAAETALAHVDTFPAQADKYGPGLRGLIELGRSASAMDYAAAHLARLQYGGALTQIFEQVDAVIAPSWHMLTPTNAVVDDMLAGGDVGDLIGHTAPFDMSGSPAICLPAGFDDHGLPFGFQIVGPHLGEATLLRFGHAYQLDTEWHLRRPAS